MTPDNEARSTQRERESDNQEAPGMLGRGLTGIAGDGVVLPTLPGNTGFSYQQQKTSALIITGWEADGTQGK